MKSLRICIAIVTLLGVLYPRITHSLAPIAHLGQVQEILNDPSIPSSMRAGALDGDLFNYLPWAWGKNLPRVSHEYCASGLAIALLNIAKTDIEKAYAYGWAYMPLPGDIGYHNSGDIIDNFWRFSLMREGR